jgi:hypothetical protein
LLEAIKIIVHEDREILFVDFSRSLAREVEQIAREIPDYTTTKPRNSVLILSDFSGALFDEGAIKAVKEAAVFDKPFVRKSALIGTEGLPIKFVTEIRNYSRRNLLVFETRKAALAWLVSEP